MLKRFPKSSELGAERYRKAKLTAVMNVLSQIIQLATGLISVPLALNYVGVERFGIWMTLSTALTFITFSDLGVGIGMQDRMTKYISAGEYVKARNVFVNSLIFVVILFVIGIVSSQLLITHIDLAGLFSLKSQEAIDEIIPTTKMVIFILCLGLVSGVVQRVFNALQEGFLVAAIQCGSRVLSLWLIFVVVDFKLGLPALVFVVGGLSSVALLLVGFPILIMRHDWISRWPSPHKSVFDAPVLMDVLKTGSLGLGAAVAIYFVNNSIPVLMAKNYGPEEVADYAILLKLVSIPGLLLTYILLPLWPAITEAKEKNDNIWIKKTYRKCFAMTGWLAIFSTIIILMFGKEIIRAWAGNERVVPGGGLIFASVVFMVVGYWNTVSSIILNGLSMYKGQATYGIFLAILFTGAANFVPNSWPAEVIIWVICSGYFLRCLLMQYEIYKFFRIN